jgi:hypothetical protein
MDFVNLIGLDFNVITDRNTFPKKTTTLPLPFLKQNSNELASK